MSIRAKNGTVSVQNGTVDYIRFGSGVRVLVMLPGLGDSLRSVKGTALPMALLYRMFCRDFTVYALSRKQPLLPGCTTRDMARDAAEAMQVLGIDRADVLGVSMGGMIAQWLAAEHPQRVNRLVLAVTCPCPNPVLQEAVGEWMTLAKAGDHAEFLRSNLRRIYSPSYCRKNLWAVPLLSRLTKPRSYDRFFLQADACLTHDATEVLPAIQMPTLVIGGEQDLALGGEASRLLAERIGGAQLRMYPQWGHGLYEEAPDFNQAVLRFLTQ